MGGDFSYSYGYGGNDPDTFFLMASITKLFTTTCIFVLKEQDKLSLDDKITKYIQEDMIKELHFYKGKDYSMDLLISDLLFQTSGLPDDFEEDKDNTKENINNQDKQCSFEDVLTLTKKQKPHFIPNKGKRAHYASINLDILGAIIENVTNKELEDVYKQFIHDPLEMKNTYLPKSIDDFVLTFYYKDQVLHRTKFLNSSGASGGGISTARELMVFIKAFFMGKLFDKAIFNELKTRNKLQFAMYPIHYGAGFMGIPLNGLTTFFMGKGELMGHSDSSGSFAFYYPKKDIFFVGDVSQVENAVRSIRLIQAVISK